MDAATRSAWCREQGLYAAELDAWKRDAIAR
jgi:transposase